KREIEEKDVDDPHLFSKAESYYKLQIENQQLNNYLLIGGIGLMTLIITLLGIFGWQQRRANKLLKSQKSEISQQNKAIEKKNEALEKQTGEIASQRDQLALQNQQIKEAQEEIETANHKLMNMNEGLEHLVEERTRDLRKTNEALVLANEELDTLIYRASHDFKGPVATLAGLSNIARMEADQNSTVRPLIDRIEDTAYKMDEMLEKLHTVSYIIGKDLQHEIITFDQIIHNIKSLFADAIDKENVEFEVEIPDHLYFYSDQELIGHIMENLVENSLQFRTQDSDRAPKISIRVMEEDQKVYLEMSDNGAGIPDEYKQRVFDMFFRGSEDSKGNGLGLYVVKKALERLKAEVDIQSQLGEYTSFKIQFPN
ncbi:MAG: ATP-binding protein, partial [Bacteroidota bacterium]